MSISTEIARIQEDRDKIRAKLIGLGLADTTSNLDELADAVDNIVNQGAVQATVLEGSTYTIPAGYHNGSGTVTGLTDTAGDKERYKLQQKTVEPTKKQQPISADSGFYGLSSVTVEAIPAAYQDVTSVTAKAGDVLSGKTIVNANGDIVAGEMADNGAVSKVLTTLTKLFTIPEGYHNGKGAVSITTETKTVTPTKSSQTVSPSTDKVLESVVVNPIPADYITTTDADALASDILLNKTAYVSGVKLKGTMPNNGTISGTINGMTTMSYSIPAGYTSGGSVTLNGEIEAALRAI